MYIHAEVCVYEVDKKKNTIKMGNNIKCDMGRCTNVILSLSIM